MRPGRRAGPEVIAGHSAQRTPLDRLVLGKAAFSAASGAVLTIASTWWSSEFGSPGPAVTAGVGLTLIGYALLLAWLSGRGVTGEAGRVVAAVDAAWVLATVAVLLAFRSEFTTAGLIAAASSGTAVATLGALQWRAAGRIDTTAAIGARPTGDMGSPAALPVKAVPAESG